MPKPAADIPDAVLPAPNPNDGFDEGAAPTPLDPKDIVLELAPKDAGVPLGVPPPNRPPPVAPGLAEDEAPKLKPPA